MPSDKWGYTLSRDELPQALPSILQPCFQNLYLDSIKKYGVSTKQCTKYGICKHLQKGTFSKITFHAKILKTLNNIGSKHHKEHFLTFR